MSDLSNYVTFKDLNAELSGYQPKVNLASLLVEVDRLKAGEKLALALVLLGAAKTILIKVIL